MRGSGRRYFITFLALASLLGGGAIVADLARRPAAAAVNVRSIVTAQVPAPLMGAGAHWVDVYGVLQQLTNSIETEMPGLNQPVTPAQGGTGQASPTAHAMLVAEGTSTMNLVGPGATSGVALVSQGAAADPAFSTVVPAGGGTGLATLTAHGVPIGEGTATVVMVGPGTANQFLAGVNATSDPTFRALAPGDIPTSFIRKLTGSAGHNGAGAVTFTGAKVGDVVISITVTGATAPTVSPLSSFEATISVAGQIQQSDAANLSGDKIDVVLLSQS